MSEVPDQGMAPGQAEVSAPAAPPSAGALIRMAREAAGMHIAALAVALKVPVRRLEALEADRHDLLPDAVFTRALALTVCRSLKVDPAPVLALLPKGQTQRLTVEGRINEPFRHPKDGPGASWLPQLSRPALIAAAVLVLAAVAVYVVPDYLASRNMQAADSPAASAPAASEGSAVSVSPPPPVPAPKPTAPGRTVTETVPSAGSAPSSPPGPVPAAPVPVVPTPLIQR